MRIVLDTNILISGLISSGSAPAVLIDLWLDQQYVLVTCAEQLEELRRVAEYPHLKKRLDRRIFLSFISQLSKSSVMSGKLPEVNVCSDPDDNFIVACAIAGKADLIVTGDKKHLLSLVKIQDIHIISARECVGRLGKKT